jgi:hypothetical protein
MQAKAQKTRLMFTETQRELQKEKKTLLEAKLNLLEKQKEVATLVAKFKVLDHNSRKSEHSLPELFCFCSSYYFLIG